MVLLPTHPEPPPARWGHKATAFLIVLAASAFFAVTILWPLVAPFVPVQFAPATMVQSVVDTFDDSPAERYRP